jgi:transketolase
MKNPLINNWQKSKKKSLRDGFGKAILDLAKEKDDLVTLSADLISSTRLSNLQKQYPDQVLQVGVAEQNMIAVSAGLAIAGFVPFACSFATFSPGRCLDQIRVQLCISNLNVKLVGSHVGLSHPKDGPTAQATEDIAITRSLPNMQIVFPADFNQMLQAVKKVYQQPGPVYLRMTREPTAVFIDPDTDFQFGKAQILKQGKDLTIISSGPMLEQVLLASEQTSVGCEIINLHTIKPIDKQTIINSAKKTGLVLTVEDHQLSGGIGSSVAEILSENYPTKLKRMGINNQFGKTARTYDKILEEFALSAGHVLKAINEIKKRKNN